MRGLRLRETKYYDVDNTSKLTVVSRSLDWSLIAKEMIIATWGWGGGSPHHLKNILKLDN